MGASPTSRPRATTSTGWWRRSGQARPAASRVVTMAQAPIITFLSDYGLDDDFVGICHGVIAGMCPAARTLDLPHVIPRPPARGAPGGRGPGRGGPAPGDRAAPG